MSKRKMDGEDDERFIYENLGTVKKTKQDEYQNCPDVGIGDDYTQHNDDDNTEFGYTVINQESFMIAGDQEPLFIKVEPESTDDLNGINEFLDASSNKDEVPFILSPVDFKKQLNGTSLEYDSNNNLYDNATTNNSNRISDFEINSLKNGDEVVNGVVESDENYVNNNDEDNCDDDEEDDDVYDNMVELKVQQLDLSQPLSSLKEILISNGLVDAGAKKFEYWLQDTEKLDEESSLKWYCVEMESGNIQVNIKVSTRSDNKKVRINIADILVPCEETSTTTTTKPKRQRMVKSKPPPPVVQSPLANKGIASWSVDPEFKAIQVNYNIPANLEDWNEEHVRLWLQWASRHFPLVCNPHSDDINVTGREVCQWNVDDVRILAPTDVDNLFWTHLQLLKKCKLAALRVDKDVLSQIITCSGKGRGLNGQVQLWQFLLEILIDQSNREIVEWVGRDGEFRLIDPESVAQLWGRKKNRTGMTYEKMSRAMRYYYDGDIIHKVPSKRFHYKFVCDLRSKIGYSVSEIQDLVNSPTAAIEGPDCAYSDRLKLEILLETLRAPACLRRAVPITSPMVNLTPPTSSAIFSNAPIGHDGVINGGAVGGGNVVRSTFVIATPQRQHQHQQVQSISPNMWLNNTQQQQQIISYVSHEQDVVSA